MKDVFLSYASADRERAGRLVETLEASGLTVWWDRELAIGQSYDGAIQRQLEASRCVVVLWSRASVESDWVKAEAQDAKEKKRLFPAFLDPVKPPLEYRYLNGVDLTGWSGSADDPELLRLLETLRSKARRSASPDATTDVMVTPEAPAPKAPKAVAPAQSAADGGTSSTGPGPVTAIRLAHQLGELLERIGREKRAGRRRSTSHKPGDVTLARVITTKLALALASVADSQGRILPSRLALRYLGWSVAVPTALVLAFHAIALLLGAG